jgi:hypothetical protein
VPKYKFLIHTFHHLNPGEGGREMKITNNQS